MEHAEGRFRVVKWDEHAYEESDAGLKLTTAKVDQQFEGDLSGEGRVTWLMCYRPDGTADWVGLQRVSGDLHGREGSLVLRMTGTFDGRVAYGEWEVVQGSGTAGLTGLRGAGTIHSPLGTEASFSLDYEIGDS